MQISDGIECDVSLKDKNWFRTGGNARYFAQPKTLERMLEAVRFADEHTLDLFMLGHGANILVSDAGFDGMVIRPALEYIEMVESSSDSVFVRAGAGVGIQDLISWCLDRGYGGLEEFSGIPGTVGGSVFINIHFFEHLLSTFLIRARVLDRESLRCIDVDRDWFCFGYNYSTLHNDRFILVDATFKLRTLDAQQASFAKGRRFEMVRYRASRYPAKNTCGSFFRNFYPEEVTAQSDGKKLIWIAYYLDLLGIKGALRVGGAVVSYQHANMIVTDESATSADVIALARIMQTRVYERFGIIPKPECQLIGFKENLLL